MGIAAKLRSSSSSADRDLVGARAALDQELGARETVTELIAAGQAQREALAEDAAGYAQNESRLRELEAESARLAIVVSRRERELAEAERLTRHHEWAQAGDRLKKAYAPRKRASAGVAAAVEALAAAVGKLERERATVSEREHEFVALVPSDVDDYELPGGSDEAEWPPVDEHVIEVLRAGALQPEAADAARAGRNAERRQREEAARLPNLVERVVRPGRMLGGETSSWTREQVDAAFVALSAEEQASVLRAAEAELASVEREIRTRFELGNSLFGPRSEQADRAVRDVVDDAQTRIERLRELDTAELGASA